MSKNKNKDPEQLPEGIDRLLVHACCAPCSGAILEWLKNNGITPVIFYSNPNIFPREEYEKRRDECARYAADMGCEMVEDAYDHDAWLQHIAGLEGEPERGSRCSRCFAMRLRRAAEYARANGYALLTTTLASSRWKNLEQVDAAGDAAVADIDSVVYWHKNWRKGGLQERRGAIIRERNFYNQLYCGCEFSMSRESSINS